MQNLRLKVSRQSALRSFGGVVSAVSIVLVALLGCKAELTVKTTRIAPKFSITSRTPFIVRPGDTVSLVGEGFAEGMRLTSGNLGCVDAPGRVVVSVVPPLGPPVESTQARQVIGAGRW